MAHQCWNDGTDRSTLPIHGISDIGKYGEMAAPEVAQHGIFFRKAKQCCQFYSLVTFVAVTAFASGMFTFQAATRSVAVFMKRATTVTISFPDI